MFLGIYIDMIRIYEIDELSYGFQTFIMSCHSKLGKHVAGII
jgi:hypothetical protein